MFRDFFRRLHITVLTRDEEGQTMAEYAVVLAVITLAAVGAFLALGKKIGPAIDTITGYV
jgi:Flp pilus assembly pilin Flp